MRGIAAVLVLATMAALVLPGELTAAQAPAKRDVGQLRKQLASADPQERGDAVRLLADAGKRAVASAAPALVALLEDANEIRLPSDDFPAYSTPGRQAAFALSSLGHDAVRRLTSAFRRLNEVGQANAIDALAGLDDPDAARFVVEVMLDTGRDFDVRLIAASRRAKQRDGQAVPILLQALDTPNADQALAAEALADLGERSAVEPLARVLRTANDFEQREIAKALGRLKDPRAIRPLLDTLRDGPWYEARAAAAEALYGIADRAYPELIAALYDKSGIVGEKAAVTIAVTRDRSAIPELAKVLADPAARNRDMVTRALAMFGEEGVAAVERLLHDSDAAIRLKVVKSALFLEIGAAARTRVMGPIVLTDESAAVRAAAVSVLSIVDSDVARDVMLRATHDGDPTVRRGALDWFRNRALHAKPSMETIEPIGALVDDPDAAVQKDAGAALAQLRNHPGYLVNGESEDAKGLWASYKTELMALDAFNQRTIHLTGVALDRGKPLRNGRVQPMEQFAPGRIGSACREKDYRGCIVRTDEDGRFDVSISGSSLSTTLTYGFEVSTESWSSMLGRNGKPLFRSVAVTDERIDFGTLETLP